jgi:hypothetical protein
LARFDVELAAGVLALPNVGTQEGIFMVEQPAQAKSAAAVPAITGTRIGTSLFGGACRRA